MTNWIDLLIGSLSGLSITFIIILVIYLNPEKFEHWMKISDDILFKATSTFPKVNHYFDRRAVASSTQDLINGKRLEINKEASEIILYPVKIEWVKSEEPAAFIKDGVAIVRLRPYINQDRNIVETTMMFLNKSLLPQAKIYLDETLRQSCLYKIARQILVSSEAFAYFIETQLNPAIQKNAKLKNDLKMLDDMDRAGFFTHVLLREVKLTGDKLLDTVPDPIIERELRDFAIFLWTIATKRPDEYPPLGFKGRFIKAVVVLVARGQYLEAYGIEPYIRRVSRNVREGYENIYITGWGEEFVETIIRIKKAVEDKSVSVSRRYDFSVKGHPKGILVVCKSNYEYLTQQQQLQAEVKKALDEIVPEIKNGEIEIVSIAREKGVCCKIAVRSSSKGDANVLSVCMGEHDERIDALKSRFPNEHLTIIPWSSDIKKFITNALYTLKEQDIICIHLDEVNRVADVEVNDEAYNKIIGEDSHNLALAIDLTEWHINIKKRGRSEVILTADENLREILRTCVPEIRNNEIGIVRLARIEGIRSLVVVKWTNKDVKGMPSLPCTKRIKSIREKVKNEPIKFINWRDDPRELIINCLYPSYKKYDIISTDLNYEENVAIIRVKSIKTERFWRHSLNLIERVTGWKIRIMEQSEEEDKAKK